MIKTTMDPYEAAAIAVQETLIASATAQRSITKEQVPAVCVVINSQLDHVIIPLYEIPNDMWRLIIRQTIVQFDGMATVLVAESWITSDPVLVQSRAAGSIGSLVVNDGPNEEPLDGVGEILMVQAETSSGWKRYAVSQIKDGRVGAPEIMDDHESEGRLANFWRGLDRSGIDVD